MKKRQPEKHKNDSRNAKRKDESSQLECEVYHVIYTEKYGPLLVKFPPELSERDIIRITVGVLPGGELIVNLHTAADFGYAYNVTCPRFSEWGSLPS